MREVAAAELSGSMATNSETWIDCVEHLAINGCPQQPPLAKYLLKPVTGQRHQLRVHMNALGLPLLNDQFYPEVKRKADEEDELQAPLQLLAKIISFKDPITGVNRNFSSKLTLQSLHWPA
jgi:tRNA pseudouridine32 synthase/23S rRNA pseudouridine746 synthase